MQYQQRLRWRMRMRSVRLRELGGCERTGGVYTCPISQQGDWNIVVRVGRIFCVSYRIADEDFSRGFLTLRAIYFIGH